MIEFLLVMACVVAGFSIGVAVFFDEIRLGVQIKREARKKIKEAQGNAV